jgi:MFS family permease
MRDRESHKTSGYRSLVSQYLAALAFRDYRTMWIASLSAGAAAWALIVARGWLVYDISESSLWVGVVTFAAMIPRVLVTPLSGYLSDRFDRRNVIASMFALNVAHNLVLGVLVMTGGVEIWMLVALALVNGSARAAQMPATQALIPNLVPKRLLLNGIALSQAAGLGSRLLGPAAIAPMLGRTSLEGAFFVCSAFYVVSLVQALRIRTASTGSIDRTQSLASNLIAGLVYVYRTPTLLSIMLLAFFHCGLTMSFESMLPVLSRQQLDAEGAGFSYLMMAVGAGALASVLVLAGVRSESAKGRLFLGLGALSGLAPVVLAMSGNMPAALLAAAGMGATQAGFMTLTHTMIQSIVPDEVRGRVGGVYSVHIGGMMATANLFNGALSDLVNAQLLLTVGGVAFMVVILLSWRRATLRSIYTTGLRVEAGAAAD